MNSPSSPNIIHIDFPSKSTNTTATLFTTKKEKKEEQETSTGHNILHASYDDDGLVFAFSSFFPFFLPCFTTWDRTSS